MAAMHAPSAILERIRAEIDDAGPIGFDRFMELALYGPGAYYERPPIGIEGDFVTSPHVHPIFGELFARALRELSDHLGAPDPLRLVEMGAGDGTLAEQLLTHLADLPVTFTAVEASAGARERLREIPDIDVLDAGVLDATGSGLGLDPHVVIGHELLDNLPFRLVSGASEVRVGLDGDRLVRVEVPAEPDLALVAGRRPEADERAVPTEAVRLMHRLGRMLRRGYALFVDYGDAGGGGPVHGYRDHRVVEDVLDRPGSADNTAGVDFAALAVAAVDAGLVPMRTVSQLRALSLLGFEAWTHAELATQAASLNRGEGMEAVRRWAGRSRASILVDPTGLGRLRWFGVATPGLPRPSFLEPEDVVDPARDR
jgi:NADH dehydrogenase [ubiquinone] 1 alpha subcomplex assembly factor 7